MRKASPKPALLFCLLLAAFSAVAQRNGMYRGHDNSYLIPLQVRDELVGHASVNLADRVSADTNCYIIGVYDQFTKSVGERRFNLPRQYSFDCACFDGRELFLRFSEEGRQVYYAVFNQNAALTFDTAIELRAKDVPGTVSGFQQATLFPLAQNGIVDQVPLSGRGGNSATVRIDSAHKIWVADVAQGNAVNEILYAGPERVVQCVRTYARPGRLSPVLTRTEIVTQDAATGEVLGRVELKDSAAQFIYPAGADVSTGRIDILSGYSRNTPKHGRIKYGLCLHRLDGSGTRVLRVRRNELTTTLLKDKALKARDLLKDSYLHLDQAACDAKGTWVAAMQQYRRLPLRVHLTFNKYQRYEIASVCFLALSPDAELEAVHIEHDDGNPVEMRLPFTEQPQNGGTWLQSKGYSDVNYFCASDERNTELSFVYSDADGEGGLTIGNVVYRDGAFRTDKFSISKRGGLVPARYGHTFLITLNPETGRFDFDNIKFNN